MKIMSHLADASDKMNWAIHF